MRLSNDYANQYLDFLLGKATAPSAPAQVWAGLSTNAPETDGGTFNEVTGNGYGRTLFTVRGTAVIDYINSASGRKIDNGKQITWPKATGAYSVRGIGLFASETGGTPFAVGDLGTPGNPITVQVASGAIPMFEKNGFNVTVPG